MLKAVILTFNEETHITACIGSLNWTDGVVVLDSYSTDATCRLASDAGAEVIQNPWKDYAQQRNVALERVTADWILFVDADERATPELASEIGTILSDCTETGWWIPRYNYILGHRMRATGWYPDYQMRLLHRAHARYDPQRGVHELVMLQGKAGYLKSHLVHYNYDTLRQFWNKQRRYLDYDISVLVNSGEHPQSHAPYTQAIRHFWWRFFRLQGWRDTVWGLGLSLVMSYYEFLRHSGARRTLSKMQDVQSLEIGEDADP